MKVTVCDRCKKMADKVIIMNKQYDNGAKTECASCYNGIPVETQDLCEECYDKYISLINRFMKELSC